ncbi:hypothetical protein [Sporolituus thermophilus]|uniref:Periplasmic chaperone for outer membrane proteins Skp n=1 Tax=Sporolituus thermophilus DSM 23256 TaxID=1123285 RepID=A0A1G7HF54_9FIRM|nr:hypothetical protein [Sporolituus thermophilus]SDE99045.1 periplasmic chaperone for outer membrane proteins Skp [Sporolituus thermophilus DSM 23256]
MTRRRTLILLVFLLIAAFSAGCFRSASDTNAPPKPQVGILDVQKAVKAHPKYAELERRQQELNTLLAQAEAEKKQAAPPPARPALPDGAAGVDEALAREFDARVAAKQAEIKARLDAKAAEVREELHRQLAAYTQEVDKEYHPQIFSLQLKLKTVQLTKDEMEALQKQHDNLQRERAAKIAAKERELAAELEQRLAPAQKAAEQELAAYAQQLNAAFAQQAAAKKLEMTERLPGGQTPAPAAGQARTPAEQQAALKRAEIKVLQDFIQKDIADKAAKAAGERGLTAVLATYKVNISAVDITDAVIAEFKK